MATRTSRAFAWMGVLTLVAVGGLGALQVQAESLPAGSPAQGFLDLQAFLVGDFLGTLVFVGALGAVAAVVVGAAGKWASSGGGGMRR